MYVCLCRGVNSETVMQVVAAGARTSQEVADACGAGSVCGRCRSTVRRIIAAELAAAGELPPAALADEEAAERLGGPAPARPASGVRRGRLVEVRTYAVHPAEADHFRERVADAGLPLLGEMGVDVVHFGRSETQRDEVVDFVLIASFSSRKALERLESDAGAADRWGTALGQRALGAVVGEHRVTLLVPADVVDGLRWRVGGADFAPEPRTV